MLQDMIISSAKAYAKHYTASRKFTPSKKSSNVFAKIHRSKACKQLKLKIVLRDFYLDCQSVAPPPCPSIERAECCRSPSSSPLPSGTADWLPCWFLTAALACCQLLCLPARVVALTVKLAHQAHIGAAEQATGLKRPASLVSVKRS